MPRCNSPCWTPLLALVVVCGLAFVAGCKSEAGPVTSATSKYQVDDGKSSGGPDLSPGDVATATQGGDGVAGGGGIPREPLVPGPTPRAVQPPVTPSESLGGDYKAPEGATVVELITFIEKLSQSEPKGDTQKERLVDFQNIQRARITAAEKILASDGTSEQKIAAVNAKFESLRVLSDLGVPEVIEHTRQFTLALRDFDDPKVALIGRLIYFGIRGGDLRDSTKADPEWVLEEMQAILKEEEASADVFNVTSESARMLQQMDYLEEGQKAKAMITTAFKDVKDDKLRDGVKQFVEEMDIAGFGVEEKLEAALAGEPNALPALVDTLKKALQAPNRGRPTLAVVLQCAQYMEYSRNYEASRQIYDAVETAYKDYDDKVLQEHKEMALSNGRKRVNLIGKPFEVTGEMRDGSAFDWNQYKGKFVLVDFWASWCQPCLAEMPNIKKNFDAYREKGFEVVGVNLDENPQMVERFFKVQKLPWPTVVSADAEANGFRHPMAVKCGVDAIPFIVLVGKDGKVIDLHLRGNDLGKALAELLGPPAEAPKQPGAPETKGPAPETKGAAPKTGAMEGPADTYFVSFQEKDADKNASEGDKTASEGDERDKKAIAAAKEQNPYSPSPKLTSAELVEFIFKMEEKPQSIQKRKGFPEALLEAAERILADKDAKDKHQVVGALTKFRVLHKAACFEDKEADRELVAFLKQMRDDKRPKIAREVEFLALERRAIDADALEREERQKLLADLKTFCEKEDLTERHLRLASNTVRVLNTVADIEQREKQFGEFGKLFVKSSDRQLASYGKKLAKSPKDAVKKSDLVGKPLELAGLTALGVELDWEAYRGKVVLVDFWATWCGPCRREMPKLQAFYQENKQRGLDVVAVNLDKDEDALSKYLDENKISWVNLVGEDSKALAAKYGVSGIPTMMLINRKGVIMAVSHKMDDLKKQALELLDK